MKLIDLQAAAQQKAGRAQELLKPYRADNLADVPAEVLEQVTALITEYDDLVSQIDATQLRESLFDRVDDAHKANFVGLGPRSGGAQPDLEPPDGQGGFATFAEYLRAVWVNDKYKRLDRRLARGDTIPDYVKDMAEGTGATGGFLVPVTFANEILQVAGEGAIVRPRAFTLPMTRRQHRIPALDYTTGVAGSGQSAFFGGVHVHWTEESALKTETQPAFRMIDLVAHKMAGWTKIEDELIEDSPITVSVLLTKLFGMAVRWFEDYAFLRQDGVAKPLGVTQSPVTIVVPRTTPGTFVYQDAINLWAQLLPGAVPVWVMSVSVKPTLPTFVDPNGNYIWHPAFGISAATGPMPGGLLGYPIYWTEKLPALGVTGDVMLADFGYYLLGDRKALTIAYSSEYLFPYDEMAWRFVSRVDGQPWMNAPINLQDGTQVSPFLILGPTS